MPLCPDAENHGRPAKDRGHRQKPVNVLAAGPWSAYSRDALAKAGAARISLGSALARVTHRAIHDAATELFENGDFSGLGNALPGADVDKMMD